MSKSHSNSKTDLVFSALGNSLRRTMLDLLKQMPGCSLNDLCEHFEMSRIGVMKHLDLLVESGLVVSRKQGRTRQLFFNAAPIQMIYDRWTDEYSSFWVAQAVDLKYEVESANAEIDSNTSTKKRVTSSSRSVNATKRKKKPTAKSKKKKVA